MFGVGGVVAVLCSLVNAYAIDSLGMEFTRYTRYVAPLIEETLKAGVLVYLFRTHRIGFLIDAGILGFAVGAGFSFVENLYYLYSAQDAHYGVWAVRGFGTAIMHGGAVALFAIIAETMTERHRKMNALLYLPGLIIAFLVHSIFNHFPVSWTRCPLRCNRQRERASRRPSSRSSRPSPPEPPVCTFPVPSGDV